LANPAVFCKSLVLATLKQSISKKRELRYSMGPTSAISYAPLTQQAALVAKHQPLGSGLHVLWLQSTDSERLPFWGYRPGQFFMLDLPEESFWLRRPFSPAYFDEQGRMALVYREVGAGTQRMSRLLVGESLNLLGPLGKPFPEEVFAAPRQTLLVAGGVGIAPLLFFAQWANFYSLARPLAVYGARTRTDLVFAPEWAALCEASVCCTDDGSAGESGSVLVGLQRLQDHPAWSALSTAVVCGPNRMMQGSVEVLKATIHPKHLYASLENHMPCGTGACYGCVVALADPAQPPVRVCLEGPVFSAQQLGWGGASL
jgi:dihydroorotate dehydrogenase electron transfer subunit